MVNENKKPQEMEDLEFDEDLNREIHEDPPMSEEEKDWFSWRGNKPDSLKDWNYGEEKKEV